MTSSTVLIQALQHPDIFPHEVTGFELIETHISWVLLTGSFVYKIKKPVNLGFLDFSTLEKRKFYCHEEVRKNSRLAPGIYLDVIAITGSAQFPSLNGQGEVIDYAVKMRQFTAHHTFDHLCESNTLSTEQIRLTAKMISEFHSHCPVAHADQPFGEAEHIMQPVRDNFIHLQKINLPDQHGALQYIQQWCDATFEEIKQRFIQRKHAGFIRECHGDLHLGNIALINGIPTAFDSIEFNPDLYWIDTLNDVAFLQMDLQQRQRGDLASVFINTYLQQSGDYSGLDIFRFYCVYRAIVMAKVNAIRATQCSVKQRPTHQRQIESYIKLAKSYIQPLTPQLIIMHGVSGSGKSHLAYKIIEHFPAIIIRSDAERKRLFASDTLSTKQLYSIENTQRLYQHLLSLSHTLVAAGYSVIVDATFLHHQHRQKFFDLSLNLHIAFKIIHSYCHPSTLEKRLQQRRTQHDNISDANQQILQKQLEHYSELTANEKKYCFSINTEQTKDYAQLIHFIVGDTASLDKKT